MTDKNEAVKSGGENLLEVCLLLGFSPSLATLGVDVRLLVSKSILPSSTTKRDTGRSRRLEIVSRYASPSIFAGP